MAQVAAEHAEMCVQALTMLGDLAGLASELKSINRRYEQALTIADDEKRRTAVARASCIIRTSPSGRARIALYRGNGRQSLVLVKPLVYGLAVFHPTLERFGQHFRSHEVRP